MSKSCFWCEGLRFSCTGCGACCKGAPGTIYFSPEELDRLREHLDMPMEEMLEKYFRPYGDSYSARDDFDDYHCVFYDNGCTIYEFRPTQCRTYPFWRRILKSESHWKEEGEFCPGIDQGELHDPGDIAEAMSKRVH